jgi:DNA gyrase/topoisomerase IV subunit A
VMLMKLEQDEQLVGAKLLRGKSGQLNLENEKGTVYDVSLRKYEAVTRGGKGHALFKRGKLVGKVAEDPELPTLPEPTKPNSRAPKPN